MRLVPVQRSSTTLRCKLSAPLTGSLVDWSHLLCGECRAKTEQAHEQKLAKEKSEQGSASKRAAQAPASTDAKPKPRAKSGMDKTERDVHHVLYKVIGQVGYAVIQQHLCCTIWPVRRSNQDPQIYKFVCAADLIWIIMQLCCCETYFLPAVRVFFSICYPPPPPTPAVPTLLPTQCYGTHATAVPHRNCPSQNDIRV